MQAAVCAALLGLALACRLLAPGLLGVLRAGYLRWFEQQSLAVQPVRFAAAVFDSLWLQADAAPKPPEGCSLDAAQPGQKFCLPVADFTLSSDYGWRSHPVTGDYTFHRGADLACAEGAPVLAAMDGIAAYTLYSASAGNCIRLHHAGGYDTAYCHLQYVFVRAGEAVSAGQPIGTAGRTGNATGPHLHFSILYNDCYEDPSALLGPA